MQNLIQTHPPKVFEAIEEESVRLGFDMPSAADVNALLRVLVASKPDGNCLELGTGTGLATAWILDGLEPAGRLTTVDNEERWLAVARKHLGADSRLKIVCADGDAFLIDADAKAQVNDQANANAQVNAQKYRDRYDFIFADTWAGKYQQLELALGLLKRGGIYVIDDMLEQPNWPAGHAHKAQVLLETLSQRKDLIVSGLPWSCGVVVAVKV